MSKRMIRYAVSAAAMVLLLAAPANAASINKSIKIGAGEESGGATSVNGSVTVGADATVTGGIKTVNGKIRVDDGAEIRNAATVNGSLHLGNDVQSRGLSTVNGSIRLGENCVVDGSIEAVNGSITTEKGSSIADGIENVNGDMEIQGSVVSGDLSTVNGDIEIVEGSVLKGDLIVEKPGGWGWNDSKRRKPRVVIGPGARVEGTIIAEREIELYISDAAEVGGVEGKMTLDDAVRFSGNKP